ncbi:hypothetical protein D9M71_613260 [compost metagenome]
MQSSGGYAHTVAVGTGVGDGAHELEKLRGPQDGIRHTGVFDQLLLSHLGAKVPAFQHALGAHHAECNVMLHPAGLFGGKQIAPAGFEEA